MHPRHPSHLLFVTAGLLALAGCSKSEEQAAEATEAAEMSTEAAQNANDAAVVPPQAVPEAAPAQRQAAGESATTQPPEISRAAAPGVAFSYRYAFALPAKAIAGVLHQHAAACERLGAARCQVTGMSYDQPDKERVSARLELMLAPEVAHGFGSDAIAAVEKAEGTIENAAVEGDNASGAIEDSQRLSGALRAQLGRIEKRLATPGLSKEEKTQLARRAVELRAQLGNEQQVRQDKEATLAMTPMSLTYGTEGLFSGSNASFGKAAASSFGSLQGFLAFLLTAAGLLLPWLLLGALVVLLLRFRAMKQRLAEATGGAADSAPPQA